MPRPTTRKEVLDSLRKTIADGSIVVGAGAGTIPPQDRYGRRQKLMIQALASLPNSSRREALTSFSSTILVVSAWPDEARWLG